MLSNIQELNSIFLFYYLKILTIGPNSFSQKWCIWLVGERQSPLFAKKDRLHSLQIGETVPVACKKES